MSPTPLYSVKGYKGAHVVLSTRDTEAGIIADVQLVGAPLPFSAPAADLTPFSHADSMSQGDPITLLAQEAATVYSLDPKRTQRAADLVRNPTNVQQARRNEIDEPIKPSLLMLIVKGSSGWYIVRPNFCQCPDNARGNTCKHRIAGWMHRESIIRPLAAARRVEKSQILAELTA